MTELEYELGRAPRRHSAAIRAELSKSRAHLRVTASRDFLAKLDASGPFGAMREVTIYVGQRRVAKAVALWPDRAVAVMVDPPPMDMRTLASLGFGVIPVRSELLARDSEGLLAAVRHILRCRPVARLTPGVSLLPAAAAREREVMAHA
jgi:hypothetical protein